MDIYMSNKGVLQLSSVVGVLALDYLARQEFCPFVLQYQLDKKLVLVLDVLEKLSWYPIACWNHNLHNPKIHIGKVGSKSFVSAPQPHNIDLASDYNPLCIVYLNSHYANFGHLHFVNFGHLCPRRLIFSCGRLTAPFASNFDATVLTLVSKSL